MCGLVGFLALKNPDPFSISREYARLMSLKIERRGPNSFGVWQGLGGRLTMAHRRLAIQDLSDAGSQPMHSLSGRFTIIFNGEIYNHLELRGELKKSHPNIIWLGGSDTETLLSVIEVYGIGAALQKIKGMFSFALWDSKDNKLFLARDRFGEKPLFYGTQNNIFYFSSTISAIAAYPKFVRELNKEALSKYFNKFCIGGESSIFKSIYKLEPASYLEVLLSSEDLQFIKVKKHKFWDPTLVASKSKEISTEKNYPLQRNEIQRLLEESVLSQTIADVPIGSFLSGGVDSTLITALLCKQTKNEVKTFTVGFEDKAYDESPYAKRISKFLATNHNEIILSAKDAMLFLEKYCEIYDEPFADSSQVPTYYVSKLASEHVTVALSGDGGDELFGGYNRYIYANKIAKINRLLPHLLRQKLSNICLTLGRGRGDYTYNPHSNLNLKKDKYFSVENKLRKVSELLEKDLNKPEDIYRYLLSSKFNSFEKRILLDECEPIKDIELCKGFVFEEQMMLHDVQNYLSDDILVKVDRASMANSLETRSPFLNAELFSRAWEIPLKNKLKGAKGKLVLREILADYVPTELFERPKMGFGIPISDWIKGELRELVLKILNEEKIINDKIINVEFMVKILDEHFMGLKDWGSEIWALVIFQVWYDKNMR